MNMFHTLEVYYIGYLTIESTVLIVDCMVDWQGMD